VIVASELEGVTTIVGVLVTNGNVIDPPVASTPSIVKTESAKLDEVTTGDEEPADPVPNRFVADT
jgi:hypothetical protein